MAATPTTTAVRYVAAASSKKPALGTLYLRCHVKPGAAKAREGVAALTPEAIELCVSAPPREGEANKAVVKLLSQVLGVPKSDLQITQGTKGRDKTVALGGIKDAEGVSLALKFEDMLREAAEE